jgi:hypothetical protein
VRVHYLWPRRLAVAFGFGFGAVGFRFGAVGFGALSR